jgi:hypothetical protein
MKMSLYAYAISAHNPGRFVVSLMSGANIASNRQMAYESAINEAKQEFPGYAGWCDHDVSLTRIPDEYVNQEALDSLLTTK